MAEGISDDGGMAKRFLTGDKTPVDNEGPEKKEESCAANWVMTGGIPHILENIIAHLSVSDQKSLRLVSSVWDSVTVKNLRLIHPAVEFNLTQQGVTNRIESFQTLHQNDTKSSHANFLIHNEELRPMNLKMWILYNTIIEAISTHVSSLEICFFIPPTSMKADIPATPTLNYLTVLRLDIHYIDPDRTRVFKPEDNRLMQQMKPLIQLIKASPNLQKIHWFLKAYVVNREIVVTMLHLLLDTLESRDNKNLTHLSIGSHEIEDAHFLRLATLSDLRLKCFSIKGGYHVNTLTRDVSLGQGLVKFLKTQSAFLQKLYISRFNGIFDQIYIPIMPQLLILHVQGWKRKETDTLPIPKIDYSKQFPLVRAVLISGALSNVHTLDWVTLIPEPSSLPSLSVTELEIPYSHPFSAEDYEPHVLNLILHFPNVKSLSIPANRSLVFIAMKHLPNLEELILKVDGYDALQFGVDDVILGRSHAQVEEIRMLSPRRLYRIERYLDNLTDFSGSYHPLSLMKSLKILRFHAEPLFETPDITNLSSFLVLNKMSLLDTVDFGLRMPHAITLLEEVMETLRASGKRVIYTERLHHYSYLKEPPERSDFEPDSHSDFLTYLRHFR